MYPGDALIDLDLESIRRLRPRSGQMDAMSLTAIYDSSFNIYATAVIGSRPARTMLHETMHAYQMLATSYGYYYRSLKALQTSRVMAILRLLRESGQGLKPPLIRQILGNPSMPASPQLRLELYVWYLAEMVLLYFEGDPDRFGQQYLANKMVGRRTFSNVFADLERYLVQWWRGHDHSVVAGPMLADDERTLHDEFRQLVLKMMSVDWGDTLSVLESGARIAEYWQIWPKSLADFDATLTGLSRYTMWIIHARGNGLAADPKSFALTYAALVDLALNPPLLPHHTALRAAGQTVTSLNPIDRLLAGIAVTGIGRGKVPPIRDLGRDYEMFVRAVCERNKWPTPMALADATLNAFPGEEKKVDHATSLYRLAQHFRIQMPHAFLDLNVWLNDEPAGTFFRQSFVHPVIQFNDRILYHHDKTVVAEFVSSFALHQYLRQLMVIGNAPVTVPFRATPEDLQIYTDFLGEILGREAGLQPNLRLVSAPDADHHAL